MALSHPTEAIVHARAAFLQSTPLAPPGGTSHGAERQHAEKALDYLLRFKERIKDLEDWTDARNRLFWVEGEVLAVLGDDRRAADRLECGRVALMKTGPVRRAVAIAVNFSLLMCRRLHESFVPHESNVRAQRRMVATCLREVDLDLWLRRLEKIEEVLARKLTTAMDPNYSRAAASCATSTAFVDRFPC